MANIAVDRKTKEQGQIWLMPPYSYSIRHIATELKVSIGIVHKWRQKLCEDGLLPEQETVESNCNFSPDQIFSFVVNTATLSEHELSAYCREHGLFVEQVKQWKALSIQAHQNHRQSKYHEDLQRRADKKRIKELERELERKNKALAETAALLVLREKFNALWDNSEED